MRAKFRSELVASLLEVAGVAPDVARPDAAAAWVGTQLEAARAACEALAFEDEPAGFVVVVQRRGR